MTNRQEENRRALVDLWAREAKSRILEVLWEAELALPPARRAEVGVVRLSTQRVPVRRFTPRRGERALAQADAWGNAR